ncbi:MAG: FAD-dependent oxidoreductase [SAR86 cluster bacterium]|jgi:3-oxosteroid 1-dehydrogenase|nr:FAD-dependent oxidoreductase [SAR86 cluster bacterium]
MVENTNFDFDIIVLGCGASGMLAAISAYENGLKVGIFEKDSVVGGTAAVSGGIIWAPMNSHMKDADIKDSREDAINYFMSLSQGEMDTELLESFIDNCSEAISFLEKHTSISLSILSGYPDYYLDKPGAISGGGRALDNSLFSYLELGEWKDKVRNNGPSLPMTLSETPLGGGSGQLEEEVLQERTKTDQRGMGQALVGGLLKGCIDRGIIPKTNVDVIKLLTKDSEVKGVEVKIGGKIQKLHSSRGVIIATGGFEWNKELVSSFLRGPMTHPASPPSNTGDGLMLAQEVGASLGNMTSAWWTPVLSIPDNSWPDGSQRSSPVLMERTLPHSIIVNKRGNRFCNEATNYSALAGAFQSFDPTTYSYSNLPSWIVFDATHRARYMTGPSIPGSETPEWLVESETITELENKLGIIPGALSSSIEVFNNFVEQGEDKDFSRGKSEYDYFYGDRSLKGISATLGKIEKGPFYAVELKMGCLGTNGGPRTNKFGQVLSVRGELINGLYAVGNVMSGSTGSVYAGAGGTLGPALTFGYLAGMHCAGVNTLKRN